MNMKITLLLRQLTSEFSVGIDTDRASGLRFDFSHLGHVQC